MIEKHTKWMISFKTVSLFKTKKKKKNDTHKEAIEFMQ